jgi:hypothetical protein
MSDFLKGNFKPARDVKASETGDEENLSSRLKKEALNSIGGSMVYVERTGLEWDGEDE